MTRLGNFLKPLTTINLLKSLTFLGNFCKGVKISHFWATFTDNWRFLSGHTAAGIELSNGVYFKVHVTAHVIKPYENTGRYGLITWAAVVG